MPTLDERILAEAEEKLGEEQLENCKKCNLFMGCNSPFMELTGEGKKNVLIIAEAPGKTEDLKGVQLVGDAGRLLRSYLDDHDIDLDRDCYKINAVNCRPPKNKKPTKKQLRLCKSFINNAIEELEPDYIWLMGGSAIESFYDNRFSGVAVSRWRGLVIPDKLTGAWICPMFHPSYVLRNEYDDNIKATFKRDIGRAVKQLDKTPPVFDKEPKIDLVLDFKDLTKRLNKIINKKLDIAFDYETTNLKPFRIVDTVWSISIDDNQSCFSFPYSYPHWDDREKETITNLWRTILESPSVKKIAHNLKFEDLWSRVIFKTPVNGWIWDTMTNAHIMDVRSKFTGLKFQAYINYGVDGYEKTAKKYMEPNDLGRNRLDELPLEELLLYNGLDSYFTRKIYRKQKRYFSKYPEKDNCRKLFLKGLLTLSDATLNGINVDELYYSEIKDELGSKLRRITRNINKSDIAEKFEEKTGYPLEIKNKDYSVKDMRILVYDILKTKVTKETATGFKSVDKEVLSEINHPIIKRILKRRSLYKIKNTYVAQFERETFDGRINPFFDLHTTATGRSSSSMPNFQNIPKRDELAKGYIRKGIFPSIGNKLACIDYGSLEVRIIGLYSQDPTLVNYINDPSTDMHRDQAYKIFFLDEDTITPMLRYYGKNQLVFPLFYGSYYKSCAKNIWGLCLDLETAKGVKIRKHLRNNGIKKYEDFEDHIKTVEKKFWERFPVVKSWQKKTLREYRRTGEIKTFFGYARNDSLSQNEIVNSPIQGTAFHCLLWSMIKINEIAKKRWETKVIAQIHDEIVLDVFPDEEAKVLKTCKRIMTKDIREENEWLDIPLEVEVETTDINQSWYYVKEIEI